MCIPFLSFFLCFKTPLLRFFLGSCPTILNSPCAIRISFCATTHAPTSFAPPYHFSRKYSTGILPAIVRKPFLRQFLIHLTQDFVGFSHAHTEHICDVFCTVVNFFVHTVLPFLCFCIVSFCFVFIVS